MIAYKNRTIDRTAPVMIYKNLHNGLFSVKQFGLVVAHVASISLTAVSFKVGEKARQRVIVEKQKNVHAFVIGLVSAINDTVLSDGLAAVSYNPYKAGYFYTRSDDKPAALAVDQVLYCDSSAGLYIM